MTDKFTLGQEPTYTAEYWLKLARAERYFAAEAERTGRPEMVCMHIREAEHYEARAAKVGEQG